MRQPLISDAQSAGKFKYRRGASVCIFITALISCLAFADFFFQKGQQKEIQVGTPHWGAFYGERTKGGTDWSGGQDMCPTCTKWIPGWGYAHPDSIIAKEEDQNGWSEHDRGGQWIDGHGHALPGYILEKMKNKKGEVWPPRINTWKTSHGRAINGKEFATQSRNFAPPTGKWKYTHGFELIQGKSPPKPAPIKTLSVKKMAYHLHFPKGGG